MGKLMIIIPGSCLLISSLPGLALRTHVESRGKPHEANKCSQGLSGKLDIKDTHLVFSIYIDHFQVRKMFEFTTLKKLPKFNPKIILNHMHIFQS